MWKKIALLHFLCICWPLHTKKLIQYVTVTYYSTLGFSRTYAAQSVTLHDVTSVTAGQHNVKSAQSVTLHNVTSVTDGQHNVKSAQLVRLHNVMSLILTFTLLEQPQISHNTECL
jgi:hypothetical protein